MDRVWVVGRSCLSGEWEVLGIYTDHIRAINRCIEENDFVWEAELDIDYPEEKRIIPAHLLEWPIMDEFIK